MGKAPGSSIVWSEMTTTGPFIPRATKGRQHDIDMASVPLSPESLGAFDVLVVSTAHTAFKDAGLYAQVPLVVDTRNLMAPLGFGPGKPGPAVVGA